MAEDRAKSKNMKPLAALTPFVMPYRGMAIAAVSALVVTAMLSLILPLAVRRVIDGFAAKSDALLNQYFGAAIVIAGLLAIATALRNSG